MVGVRRGRIGLALVAAVAIFAGLLFGYDQGVTSGALDEIEADFEGTG